ncbi:MAG: ABC-type transport auxiliary lipoprotein family protein [Geminicoccaceae bacterium]
MRRRGLLGGVIGLGLSGCAAVNAVNRRPPELYELTPKSTYPSDLARTDVELTVEPPTATAGLNSARIALRPTPTRLEYYADATWIDVVPEMIHTLLIESFDNSGAIDVLPKDVIGVRADYALIPHIREFQAEYAAIDQPPTVRVRLQSRLLRLPKRTSLASTSKFAEIKAQATDLPTIVSAFDEAFGRVAKDLVIWTVEEVVAAEGDGRAI